MFRGNPSLHNPEDLFLAAISSCHMLSYLALCARKGVTIIAYEDDATASLALDASYEGKFDQVMLNPVVTVANADQAELARTLHEGAHRTCYIASSCSVPIHHNVSIRVAADS